MSDRKIPILQKNKKRHKKKQKKSDQKRYKLIKRIGKGSFGDVYQGLDSETGDTIAIKIIDLESADDEIEDIQKEVSFLSECSSQYITKYYTSVTHECELWIIMEYLDGGSILDALEIEKIDEPHIAVIARETLLGLAYLHSQGKIHRDIKAANILLDNKGQIKLADFGVSGQLSATMTKRNTFVGTPYWMAPEVIQQCEYDQSADVWSFGITLIETALGEPPHAHVQPMRALFVIPKSNAPRLEDPRFSKSMREFISLCLHKDPKKRATCKDLLNHKFIKGAGRTSILLDLVERFKKQQVNNEEVTNTDEDEDEDQDGDVWDFNFGDTVKAKDVQNHIRKTSGISFIDQKQFYNDDEDNDDEEEEDSFVEHSDNEHSDNEDDDKEDDDKEDSDNEHKDDDNEDDEEMNYDYDTFRALKDEQETVNGRQNLRSALKSFPNENDSSQEKDYPRTPSPEFDSTIVEKKPSTLEQAAADKNYNAAMEEIDIRSSNRIAMPSFSGLKPGFLYSPNLVPPNLENDITQLSDAYHIEKGVEICIAPNKWILGQIIDKQPPYTLFIAFHHENQDEKLRNLMVRTIDLRVDAALIRPARGGLCSEEQINLDLPPILVKPPEPVLSTSETNSSTTEQVKPPVHREKKPMVHPPLPKRPPPKSRRSIDNGQVKNPDQEIKNHVEESNGQSRIGNAIDNIVSRQNSAPPKDSYSDEESPEISKYISIGPEFFHLSLQPVLERSIKMYSDPKINHLLVSLLNSYSNLEKSHPGLSSEIFKRVLSEAQYQKRSSNVIGAPLKDRVAIWRDRENRLKK